MWNRGDHFPARNEQFESGRQANKWTVDVFERLPHGYHIKQFWAIPLSCASRQRGVADLCEKGVERGDCPL
jgi:hypothetical protein